MWGFAALAPGVPSAPLCSPPSTLSPASLGFLWLELFFRTEGWRTQAQ